MNSIGDLVTEKANEGTDTVQSSGDLHACGQHREFDLTGTAAIKGSWQHRQQHDRRQRRRQHAQRRQRQRTFSAAASANDVMTGGQGADTYVVAPGGGSDLISNADTAISVRTSWCSAPASRRISCGSRAAANDLVVSVLGATDRATLQG